MLIYQYFIRPIRSNSSVVLYNCLLCSFCVVLSLFDLDSNSFFLVCLFFCMKFVFCCFPCFFEPFCVGLQWDIFSFFPSGFGSLFLLIAGQYFLIRSQKYLNYVWGGLCAWIPLIRLFYAITLLPIYSFFRLIYLLFLWCLCVFACVAKARLFLVAASCTFLFVCLYCDLLALLRFNLVSLFM